MKSITKQILISILILFVSSVSGQNFALNLDGSNDKIGVADATELNPTGPFTLEAWINAESWESSIWAGVIIGKQATSPDRGYCLTVGKLEKPNLQ